MIDMLSNYYLTTTAYALQWIELLHSKLCFYDEEG